MKLRLCIEQLMITRRHEEGKCYLLLMRASLLKLLSVLINYKNYL